MEQLWLIDKGGGEMSRFQVGDEVAVDFSGKITKIELCYDGLIKYVVETKREMCMVMESAVLPLPKSEGDFKEVTE